MTCASKAWSYCTNWIFHNGATVSPSLAVVLQLPCSLHRASLQLKRPFDSAQDMLLIGLGHRFRILTFEIFRRVRVPHILAMTQRGVKDSTFAVFLGPGNRKIPRGFIIRMFIEHEQAMDFAAVEIFDEINFIL